MSRLDGRDGLFGIALDAVDAGTGTDASALDEGGFDGGFVGDDEGAEVIAACEAESEGEDEE